MPAYRRLWEASIVTVIGAQLTVVAVPAQIYAITRSSTYVGLTGLFGLVPLVVFGLYGGALADVMDRRRLMMITTVGLIASSAAFFVQALLGLHNVWLLLGIFALQQSFFAGGRRGCARRRAGDPRGARGAGLHPLPGRPVLTVEWRGCCSSGGVISPPLGGYPLHSAGGE